MPVGGGLVAQLEEEVREIGIHPEGCAARDRRVADVGHGILDRQRVDVAESEERLELQPDLRGSLDEVETDKDLVGVGHQDDTLGENDLTDLVGDLRDGVGLEIDHVLVPAGLVDVAVAMDTEVELLAVHHEALVERGQEQELVTAEAVERHCQESMVTAGIASHDGRIAVGACLVGADNLSLQRI